VPQVYNLLTDTELPQVTFDPEALPEHPRAQLASFGSPLIACWAMQRSAGVVSDRPQLARPGSSGAREPGGFTPARSGIANRASPGDELSAGNLLVQGRLLRRPKARGDFAPWNRSALPERGPAIGTAFGRRPAVDESRSDSRRGKTRWPRVWI
jgi:hypothetical protein